MLSFYSSPSIAQEILMMSYTCMEEYKDTHDKIWVDTQREKQCHAKSKFMVLIDK